MPARYPKRIRSTLGPILLKVGWSYQMTEKFAVRPEVNLLGHMPWMYEAVLAIVHQSSEYPSLKRRIALYVSGSVQ